MRVAISSASAAVTRTLEAILRVAGHERSPTVEGAELLIRDTIHPLNPTITGPAELRLVASLSTDEQSVTCPIRPLVLIQQLQARAHIQSIALGHGWALELIGRTLVHEGLPPVSLTEKESSLLKALAQVHPAALGREALLADIWGVGGTIDTHTLETHIYRLRAKLSGLVPAPCDILTEDGAYRLVTPADS